MKFWLDVLEQFCSPRDSVYCIFGGTKTMHAVNVSFSPWFKIFLPLYLVSFYNRSEHLLFFLQMLSLRHYGIEHKVDKEDYMQSLQEAPELDKNDFCQSAYSVKKKRKIEEVPVPHQSRPFANPTSEFDDDDDIQEEEYDSIVCDNVVKPCE